MKKYDVFKNLIPNLNHEPFLASFALFDKINLETNLINSENDIGFDDRKFNPKQYDENFIKVLNEHDEILTLEDSSYEGLSYVLKKYNLNSKIYHINEILLAKYDKFAITNTYKDFNICLYEGYFTNLAEEVLIKLNANITRVHNENCGYFLKHISLDLAYKMAADILLKAYDSGCDFMVVSDIRAFDMLRVCQKELQKISGRKFEFEIFSLSELLLLATGEDWDLVTAKHKANFKS